MLIEISKNKKLRLLTRALYIKSFTFIFFIYLNKLLIIKIVFLKINKNIYINIKEFILKLLLVIILSNINILSYNIIFINSIDFIDLLNFINLLNLLNILLLYFYSLFLFFYLKLFNYYYLIASNLNFKIK